MTLKPNVIPMVQITELATTKWGGKGQKISRAVLLGKRPSPEIKFNALVLEITMSRMRGLT